MVKWITGIVLVFVLSYLSWRLYNIVPVDRRFTVAMLGGAITLGQHYFHSKLAVRKLNKNCDLLGKGVFYIKSFSARQINEQLYVANDGKILHDIGAFRLIADITEFGKWDFSSDIKIEEEWRRIVTNRKLTIPLNKIYSDAMIELE